MEVGSPDPCPPRAHLPSICLSGWPLSAWVQGWAVYFSFLRNEKLVQHLCSGDVRPWSLESDLLYSCALILLKDSMAREEITVGARLSAGSIQ